MKKNNVKLIINSLFLILFIFIGFLVKDRSVGTLLDIKIMDYLHRETNIIILNFMKIISFIGSAKFLIPVIIIVIIYNFIKKDYYPSKLLLMSTLGSYILNYILKLIFNRTRPIDYFLVEQSGLSYPSGHSMIAMTSYLTLAYLISMDIQNRKKKRWVYFSAISFIFLMGISRLYLGVHWPTDIIGGFLMGFVFFQITIEII